MASYLQFVRESLRGLYAMTSPQDRFLTMTQLHVANGTGTP
jgi:hypothetical protein